MVDAKLTSFVFLVVAFSIFALISLSGCINQPVCGNGVCEIGENTNNCSANNGGDCPPLNLCGNDYCDINENIQTCPVDCNVIIPLQPVDTTPPVIKIISPVDLVSVSNTIFFTVAASDNSGKIASLKLYVDGNVVKEFTNLPDGNYEIPLALGLGSHVFSADANDYSGNFAIDPVTVRVISPYITRVNGVVYFNVTFAGVPGNKYNVERTLSLSSPDWNVVATAIADSNGWFLYQQAATGPMAFFRATSPLVNGSCQEQDANICADYEVCAGNVLVANNTYRCCQGMCKLPESFDWRSRHGKNWITSVKDQGAVGTCWDFGIIGSIEAGINLYYNAPLNADLSEQDMFSCVDAGNLSTGQDPFEGLGVNLLDLAGAYARDNGITVERYFPYANMWVDCNQKNPQWINDYWKITSYAAPTNLQATGYFDSNILKVNLIENGPIALGVQEAFGGQHLTSLIGYQKKSFPFMFTAATTPGTGRVCTDSGVKQIDDMHNGDKTCAYWVERGSDALNSGIYTLKITANPEKPGTFIKNFIATRCSSNEICFNSVCVAKNNAYGPLVDGQNLCAIPFSISPGSNPELFSAIPARFDKLNKTDFFTIKNSWGSISSFEDLLLGYGDFEYFSTYSHPYNTVISYPVKCTDADSDGYCYWGISNIGLDSNWRNVNCLSSCSNNPNKDWDDSNAAVGTLGKY